MPALSVYARATNTEVKITLARDGVSCERAARKTHLMEWVVEESESRGDDDLGRAAARIAVMIGEAIDEVEIGKAMVEIPDLDSKEEEAT
jgi:hypothetical protein